MGMGDAKIVCRGWIGRGRIYDVGFRLAKKGMYSGQSCGQHSEIPF